jgi:phosphatidylglycerophosphate synthase
VWIVLGRDLLILATAGVLLAFSPEKRDFSASEWGKISTGFQIGFVFAVLLDVRAAAQVLLWVVTVVTVWSGVDYARRAFHA